MVDQDIVKMLEIYRNKYNLLLDRFPNKKNILATFEYGKIIYLKPVCLFVLPFIVYKVKNSKNSLDKYLPYVLDEYKQSFLNEIKNFNKSDLQTFSDVAKEILNEYNSEVLDYEKAPVEEKKKFVYNFCYTHELQIEKIASYAPGMALGLIANLRTPEIQFNLVRNESISESIRTLILLKWIHEDWNNWLEDYFYYPRTNSMEEFMEQWTARNKLHIKHGKMFFDNHYEAVKIWLKNKEKIREKIQNSSIKN